MYRAIAYFVDLQDANRSYNAGDIYPRKGYEPTKERIEELATDKNARKVPVIKEINDHVKEVKPEDVINPPEEVTEKPKRKGKAKKDA